MDDDGELELEVGDLPPEERHGASAGATRRGARASSLLRRLWRWQGARQRARRLIGGIAAAGAVLLALAVILLSSASSRADVAALLHLPAPTPAPAVAIGTGTYLLADTVPWGMLRLDGKPIIAEDELAPPTPEGSLMPAFEFPTGRHLLEYDAPPFPPVRCIISIPQAAGDTCSRERLTFEGAGGLPLVMQALDLRASLTRLAPGQRLALQLAISSALSASVTPFLVRSGDHYRSTDGQVATAREPLEATPIYTLVDGSRSPPIYTANGAVCAPLCPQSPLGGSWMLQAHVRLAWSYTTSAGSSVTAAAPAAAAPVPPDALIDVRAYWSNGAWHVSFPADPLLSECSVAQAMMARLRVQGQPLALLAGTAPSYLAEGGCLLQVSAPNTPIFFLLYRCGVLLAADPSSQKLLPALPVADAHEQALALMLSS